MNHFRMFVLRASIVLLVVSLAAAAGCNHGAKPQANKAERRFRFEPTDKPQHVVFLTMDWVGGGGDPVLTGPNFRPTLYYEGKPVYLTWNAKKQVRDRLGPQPEANLDGRILVEAKVHLEPRSVRIPTNPPKSKSIYAVVIDELIHAEWFLP